MLKIKPHVLHANYIVGKKGKLEVVEKAMQLYL